MLPAVNASRKCLRMPAAEKKARSQRSSGGNGGGRAALGARSGRSVGAGERGPRARDGPLEGVPGEASADTRFFLRGGARGPGAEAGDAAAEVDAVADKDILLVHKFPTVVALPGLGVRYAVAEAPLLPVRWSASRSAQALTRLAFVVSHGTVGHWAGGTLE